MNTVESCTMSNPYGVNGECAKITIEYTTTPFLLKELMHIGEQYTFGMWIKSETEGSVSFCGKTYTTNNEWQRIESTFEAEEEALLLAFGAAGAYYIYHAKLEFGNQATDWTPSPDDSEEKMNEFSISLEGAKEDAVYSMQEQFYASTSPTALEGGAWQDTQPAWAEGMYIWRRTLVSHGNGTTEYTPSENGVCITGNTGVNGTNGKDGTMLCALCVTAEATQAKTASLVSGSLTLSAGVCVSVVFRYANNASSPTLNIDGTGAKPIRLNGSALASSAYYWEAGATILFVYDGSNWNIADASALKKAEEASKTASNFISYDGTNGLQVGNKTNGAWSGYRTQTTSTAFNILSEAGEILASYGAKLIELGKNAQDAIIKLCGGKGQIEYDSSEEFIQMTGENVRVKADNMASLYSYFYDGENTVKKSAVNVENAQIQIFSEVAYNVDPETMAGTGEMSSITIDPLTIYAYAEEDVTVSGGKNVRIESGGGVVVLWGMNGVYVNDLYINDTPVAAHIIESGINGIWSYKKWSDDTAEVFGKIPVTSLAITTVLGGWYRSDIAYEATSHEYPFSFTSVPTVSVQYGTNNGVGAIVWLVDEGKLNMPPTCYLIRPTSSSGAAGYIYIHAKGKI